MGAAHARLLRTNAINEARWEWTTFTPENNETKLDRVTESIAVILFF